MAGVVVPPVDDEGFAVDSFFVPESAVDLSEDLLSDEDEVVAAASAVVEEARLSVR